MRKPLFLLFGFILLLSSCESLYFTKAMPLGGEVKHGFPYLFEGEYKFLENTADSSYSIMRIEAVQSDVYEISFQDSSIFEVGFILDFRNDLFIEVDSNQRTDSSKLVLKEYQDKYYLSWYVERYEGWQLLRFDIQEDSLKITIPSFEARLLSNYRDVSQNDYLADATDQEFVNILAGSEEYGFERSSPPPRDPTFFIMGGIALFLLIMFLYLSRRKR